MISILIPAYNEEHYLPVLLKSIRDQEYKDVEIIVAVKKSEDRTEEIALEYGAKVVKGGRFAKAYNNAAKKGKHDYLLLCADTVLPDGFLKRFLSKVKKDKVDLATCMVRSTTDRLSHRFFYFIKNNANYFDRWPIHVSSQCIFVKHDLFHKVGGYDTSLYLGEEHDFSGRAAKYGKFCFYRDLYVLNFPRRLEKEGVFMVFYKTIYSEVYRMFNSKMKKKVFDYEYGNYKTP